MNTSASVTDGLHPRFNEDAGAIESRCLVVMYHYVRDVEPLPRPGLPSVPMGMRALGTREFRMQLDQLGRTMEPIDWPTFYAWTYRRRSIPRRCFLLTFDDGLVDHTETVLPILNDRGLRGVFFIPGSILTSHRLLPAHAIHALLSALDAATLEEEVLACLRERPAKNVDWGASIDSVAAQTLYHYEPPDRARLKYLLTAVVPIELRNDVVETLFERHIGSVTRWARHWYVTWDDLVAMQSAGHTIGGHGYSHEPYSRLTPAQRREDLRRVMTVLRGGLGPDQRPFSYPYGRWSADTGVACRDAGFVHGFTTECRLAAPDDEAFCLPRVDTIDVEAVLPKELPCPSP